jgi:transcriptional regulator with XRE-family HTH domain
VTTDDARRRSLGTLVRQRRELLGLSIDEAASRAPMGPTTWTRVEQGKRVRGLTLPGIDRVLGWAENASRDFLSDGLEPTAVSSPTADAAPGSGRAHDATVTVIEPRAAARLEEISQAVGLNEHPPFPNPTSKTQQAANTMWEAYRLLAGDDPSDATVRVIRRGAVDLEELQEREKLRGSG